MLLVLIETINQSGIREKRVDVNRPIRRALETFKNLMLIRRLNAYVLELIFRVAMCVFKR